MKCGEEVCGLWIVGWEGGGYRWGGGVRFVE